MRSDLHWTCRFYGCREYTVGILQRQFGLSFWFASISWISSHVHRHDVGLPALRMKGLYLAFATLAAHFVIVYVISNWGSFTNGTDGMWMKRPGSLLGIDFMQDRNYYLQVLIDHDHHDLSGEEISGGVNWAFI